MSPRSRTLGFAALMAVVLSACASPALPGVRVRSVATDIGLGMLHAEREQPQPFTLDDLPDFIPRPPTRLPPIEPFEACPTAGLLDFPIAATPSIQEGVRPEPGVYRWVHDFWFEDKEAAAQFLPPGAQIPDERLRFFGSRIVRGIVPDAVEAFAGVYAEDAKRGSFQFTEDIRPGLLPNANTLSRSDIYRVQPSSYADTETTTGDAGEGIIALLTGWVEQDADAEHGFTSYLMVYSPPPMLLQLPVAPGDPVRWVTGGQPVNPLAVGADPQNPQGIDPLSIEPEEVLQRPGELLGPKYTMTYDGMVTGRKQIDACGDMVDSWLIEGILTIGVDGETFRVGYDYGVATQFGGLIVYEKFTLPAAIPALMIKDPETELLPGSRPIFVLEAYIGQEVPTPE